MFMTCLLAVALPLQAFAALLPESCHTVSSALVTHVDEHPHQHMGVQQDGNFHPHTHPQSLVSADSALHSDDLDISQSVVNLADPHAVSHPNCCKHGASCCSSAALLPALLNLYSPQLLQTAQSWILPLHKAVPPQKFDRPPKRIAI